MESGEIARDNACSAMSPIRNELLQLHARAMSCRFRGIRVAMVAFILEILCIGRRADNTVQVLE